MPGLASVRWQATVPRTHTSPSHDKGKIWEPGEGRRRAPDQAGDRGKGIDHFPGKATHELSAAGCLNTGQAKGLRKMLEEEKRRPLK